MTLTPEHWASLRRQAGRVLASPLRDLVAADAGRAEAYAVRVGPLYARFARQHIDADNARTWNLK